MSGKTVPQRHQCHACPFDSPSARNMQHHIRYNHIGTVCAWPGCDIQTTTDEELRTHIRGDHCSLEQLGSRNGRLCCPWPGCEKAYTKATAVARCMYFHTYDAMQAGYPDVQGDPNDGNNNVVPAGRGGFGPASDSDDDFAPGSDSDDDSVLADDDDSVPADDDVSVPADDDVSVPAGNDDFASAGDADNEPTLREVLDAVRDMAGELRLLRRETIHANADMGKRLKSMEKRLKTLEREKAGDMAGDHVAEDDADEHADEDADMDDDMEVDMDDDMDNVMNEGLDPNDPLAFFLFAPVFESLGDGLAITTTILSAIISDAHSQKHRIVSISTPFSAHTTVLVGSLCAKADGDLVAILTRTILFLVTKTAGRYNPEVTEMVMNKDRSMALYHV
ncbi:hypothetical protein M434DRAFT_33235 [Hypoxylon sp. CO27-5]|nr:hypothetical protein M434DRAFT_33235 [Hypoxylon sp. CO27-5]